jgi:hypothetical protein
MGTRHAKTLFLAPFIYKCLYIHIDECQNAIILPRQARDKHRVESTQNKDAFSFLQGVVFEYYDALNTTDPVQTLRKPRKQDAG